VANNGLYYCLLALSIVVITGTTGQVTFMQAGFVAIGAFGLSTAVAHGWNLFLGIGASMLVAAAIAAVVGAVSLRFRGLEFAVVSIAIGAVLSEFIVTRPGVTARLADAQVFGLSMLRSRNLYGVMLVFTLIVFMVVANLRRSAWGRSLRAMREMHNAIGHFGIDPFRSEIVVLCLSAATAALAGCLFALTVSSSLDPFLFTPLLSIVIVLAAVVGGLRSLWGPVLAGILFGPGQEVVGRLLFTDRTNAFPQIASAVLALFVVIKMPNGLVSAKSALKAWAGVEAPRAATGLAPAREPIRIPASRRFTVVLSDPSDGGRSAYRSSRTAIPAVGLGRPRSGVRLAARRADGGNAAPCDPSEV
jgi:ABC-type branched-subunit amino acid transport system permease subunit